MAPSQRVPTKPSASRGGLLSKDARTRTKGRRQLLGWVGLPTLSARSFVAGASPFGTAGFLQARLVGLETIERAVAKDNM